MPLEVNRSQIEGFVSLEGAYTKLLQSVVAGNVRPENLLRLHFVLADLQRSVLALPPVTGRDVEIPAHRDVDSNSVNEEGLRRALEGAGLDRYTFIFDPLGDPGSVELPVFGSLAHDLNSVHQDLAKGIEYSLHGRWRDALWTWRWGYLKHWGRHLLLAQCVLRQHLDEVAAAFVPLAPE